MKTIKPLTKRVADVFTAVVKTLSSEHGEREGRAMAEAIFSAVKGWDRVKLILHEDDELSDFILEKIDEIVSRVAGGEPLQYVLGVAPFYGMEFKVDPSTLIPRPETAFLVDMIVKDLGDRPDLKVLDLGTGSGCIAIALARHLKFAEVTAVDISGEALAVARSNAERLRARVRFAEADMLKASFPGSYDVIVSNPPYIALKEAEQMEAQVVEHEPTGALFVPDDDPLMFYRAIAGIGMSSLASGGRLYLEINPLFAGELVALLREKGYRDIEILKDIEGRDRYAVAVK